MVGRKESVPPMEATLRKKLDLEDPTILTRHVNVGYEDKHRNVSQN